MANLTAEMESLFPALLELARNEDHVEDGCPNDDTCRCANIAQLNAEFKTINVLLLAAADLVKIHDRKAVPRG